MFAQGFACAEPQTGARAALFILKLRRDLAEGGRRSSPASHQVPPWLCCDGERRGDPLQGPGVGHPPLRIWGQGLLREPGRQPLGLGAVIFQRSNGRGGTAAK